MPRAVQRASWYTVDKAAFHVHGMFAESLVIAQVQVDVVAVLRPDADVAHFQVLIAFLAVRS